MPDNDGSDSLLDYCTTRGEHLFARALVCDDRFIIPIVTITHPHLRGVFWL